MQGRDQAGDALPAHCLSRDAKSGRVVILLRGRKGCVDYTGNETPESYNHRRRLSYEQIEAMEYGSQLGFDNELARPSAVRAIRESLGLPTGPVQPPSLRAEARAPTAAAVRAVLEPERRQAADADLNFLPEFRLGKNGY